MEKMPDSREIWCFFFCLVSCFFIVFLCFKMFAASGPFKVMFFVSKMFQKCLALNWPVVSGQKPASTGKMALVTGFSQDLDV